MEVTVGWVVVVSGMDGNRRMSCHMTVIK